ncbi:uncharacterized protein LOC130624072 [Hydractinia symbiolongicarpus]|uniref:uncharacterized protein LOC130624072 n=1 Tax=Hydractinia symbiolongicarpus TaxID=13093 RepID=UPI00254BC7FF|nr:uncharacterized protein LOC130624072 [Hydractinia symbiolongicarpus]
MTYKYLGVDENVSYKGSLNKNRIQSEYFKRVRKIWCSELSGYNKYIAHNSFALPVLRPTFGILNWTKDEIKAIDIKTRKVLNMTGNFHRNSDVDRLYAPRKEGGRGLKMVKEAYESRIISINQHLHQSTQRNPYLKKVVEGESECIVRQAREFLSTANIDVEENCTPQKLSQKYLQYCKKQRLQRFEEKAMHSYIWRKISSQESVNLAKTTSWSANKYMTSHFEGYAHALYEQEINTKDLQYRRDKKAGLQPKHNNRCRLCKVHVEDITHVVSSCPNMSARYYLPLQHDPIAARVYTALRKKEDPHANVKCSKNEFVYKEGCKEYWWNVPVKTATKVKHNKPDIIQWDLQSKTCKIIEISCPADVNVMGRGRKNLFCIIFGF